MKKFIYTLLFLISNCSLLSAVEPTEWFQQTSTNVSSGIQGQKIINVNYEFKTYSVSTPTANVRIRSTGTIEAINFVGEGSRITSVNHNLVTSTGTLSHNQLENNITDLKISTGTLQEDIATEISDRIIADNAIGVTTGTLRYDLNEVKNSTYTVGSINHSLIQSTGTLSHNEIDSYIGTSTTSIYNIGQATGTLREDLLNQIAYTTTTFYGVGLATQSIRNDLNEQIAFSTTTLYTVGVATAGLRSDIIDLQLSTGTLQSQINDIGIATGTLRTDLNNEIANSTTSAYNIGQATGSLRIDLYNLQQSTYTVGSINHSLIQSTGTLSHAQIDSQIATSTTAIYNLELSTGSLQEDLATEVSDRGIADNVIGLSTGSLRTDLNLEIANSTTSVYNIGQATGSLRSDVYALQQSTYTVGSINHSLIQSTGTLSHTQLDYYVASTTTSVYDIGQATGSLRTDLTTEIATSTTSAYNLGVATGSLRTDLNLEIANSTTSAYNIGQATGTLRQDLNAVIASTYTVASINHNLIQSTGTLSHSQLDSYIGSSTTSIYNLGISTANLAISTGAIQLSLNNVIASTYTVGSINHTLIQSTGVLSHNQLDSYIATSTTSIYNIGQATGTLRSDLNAVILSTGELKTDIYNIGIATHSLRDDLTTEVANSTTSAYNIGQATGSLRTDLTTEIATSTTSAYNLGVATGSLRTDLTTEVANSTTSAYNIGQATGSLRTDLTTEVANSTTSAYNIGVATGSLRQDVTAVSLSTGTLLKLDQSTPQSVVNGAPTFQQINITSSPVLLSNVTTKEYVDQLVQGIKWQEPVISFWDPEAGMPVNPSTGDRWVSLTSSNSWVTDYIYQYTGSVWDEIIPSTGTACWFYFQEAEYVFNGTDWVQFASTLMHNNMSGKDGGDGSNQYYHLSLADYNNALAVSASTTTLRDDLNEVKASTYTVASIDHMLIKSTGTLSHPQIDLQIAISTTSIYDLGQSTGVLRTDLNSEIANSTTSAYNIGQATGALRTDLTNEIANSTTSAYNIGQATGSLRSDVYNLQQSTYTVGSINHSLIQSTGTLSHAQLDGYISISTNNIYNIGQATGSLRSDLNIEIANSTTSAYNIGLATGSLRSDVYALQQSTYSVGSIDHLLIKSTGTLSHAQIDSQIATSTTAIYNLELSTGSLQEDLATEVSDRGIADNVIGLSTGSLRTDLNLEIANSTTSVYNIGQATGTLRTDLNNIYSTTNTWTAAQIFTSSASFSGPVGFYGVDASTQSTGWNVTNSSTDTAYDANATTVHEMADVIATLIGELKRKGLLGN